jgi:hypothetical protein
MPPLAPPPLVLQAKAIQRLIAALCSELRGVAVPLVDAFAIPDHILRAPIGLRWAAMQAGWLAANVAAIARKYCVVDPSTHPHTPSSPPAPSCLPACSTTAVDPYNEYLTAIGFNV